MQLLPRRLHTRLLLAITLAMAAGILALSFWTAYGQSRQLIAARHQQAELLTRNLAEGSAHSYVLEDYAALDHFLRHSMGLPGVRRVVATDARGVVLSDFKRSSDSEEPQLSNGPDTVRIPASASGSITRTGTLLVVWQPVQAGNLLGWLQVQYGLEEVAAVQRQIWRNGIIFALVEVAVGILLVALLLRRPIRSISKLSRFARELPQHKGTTLPVERFVTEVQDLGESLNYASTELQRIEQELLELNRTLETRVEEEVAKSRAKDALLLQQARFQPLGELLMNIAHHWRQPLNNIGARVQEHAWLVANGEIPPENAMVAADQIMQELKQLSRSIEGFHLLCRPAGLDEAVLPSDAVNRSILIVRDSYQQLGISFELNLLSEQKVQGSLQDLVQCILNLFSNARDAIVARNDGVGHIVVKIDDAQSDDKLTVMVADTGGGIPQQLLNSLFDPYVTSKFRAQGVGLGLFVVRQIIEQRFNGTVEACNQGQGALITITIPLHRGEV